MPHQDYTHLSATCRCKKVELLAYGPPIASAACYCASCREAGRVFEGLPAAPPVLDADGGTSFVSLPQGLRPMLQGSGIS